MLHNALPGCNTQVVELTCSIESRKKMITERESDYKWRQKMLMRTEELELALKANKTFDFKVENDHKSPEEAAKEILGLLGWQKKAKGTASHAFI